MLCQTLEAAHVANTEVFPWYTAYAELVERQRLLWRQPGIAIVVVEDDQTRLLRGFGQVAADRPDAVDADTVFALASCSKPFAAATVASLVERGQLDWDTPVASCLPQLQLRDRQMQDALNVRDLLCNRAGLRSSEGRFRSLARDRDDLIARLGHREPLHGFRERYAYQTDMFSIAGAVVSQVAGCSWEQYAERTLWGPLGMQRSNADHLASQRNGNWARPHQHVDGQPVVIDWHYEDGVATPAGGVNASAADLARWLAFWNARGGDLLSAASVQHLVTPQMTSQGPHAEREFSCAVGEGSGAIRFESYALGWYVHDDAGDTVVVHTGSIPGFKATTGFLWDRRIGIGVLCNSDAGFLARALFQAGIDLARGRDPEPSLQAFLRLQQQADQQREAARGLPRLPLATGAAYAGHYRDQGCWGDLDIQQHGDALRATAAGGQAFRIERIGSGQFRMAVDLGRPHPAWFEVGFELDGNGHACALRMDDGVVMQRQVAA